MSRQTITPTGTIKPKSPALLVTAGGLDYTFMGGAIMHNSTPLAASIPAVEKPCRVCKQPKRLNQFSKNHDYADGFDTACKDCERERHTALRDSADPTRKRKPRWEESEVRFLQDYVPILNLNDLAFCLDRSTHSINGKITLLKLSRMPELHERFWGKVLIGDGCWEWQGCRSEKGYGIVQMGIGVGTKKAHRIAWEIINGPIPAGALICHTCDNPPCCRPDHLFKGTGRENMQDMISKGRDNFGGRAAKQE